MRQIHPVGFHEKFVASGTYTEYFEAEPTDNFEHWTVHELPDGGQLIRVDRDQGRLLIEGWRNPLNARIERIDIYVWEKHGVRGKASYIYENGSLQVAYSTSDRPRQEKEIPLPPDCIIFAGASHLFRGMMIADVARSNGECVPVCLCRYPIIYSDPVVNEFSAVTRETGFLAVAGKTISARRIQWDQPCDSVPEDIENNSETQPSFWLDEYSVLLRDVIPGMEGNQIYLTQYAHRPERPTS